MLKTSVATVVVRKEALKARWTWGSLVLLRRASLKFRKLECFSLHMSTIVKPQTTARWANRRQGGCGNGALPGHFETRNTVLALGLSLFQNAPGGAFLAGG